MLTDPREIEIISAARQKNVRDPKRSRAHFDNIFSDFFDGLDLESTRWMDLGPGQFDFAELMKLRGGDTEAVDNDPAVIELGRHKGFKTMDGNLKSLGGLGLDNRYDGVFCKLSINCFWQDTLDGLVDYCESVCNLGRGNGYIWIAPWNGVPKNKGLSDSEIRSFTETQISSFKNAGCRVFELSEKLTKHYGVHGITANAPLMVRGLNIPQKLEKLPEY